MVVVEVVEQVVLQHNSPAPFAYNLLSLHMCCHKIEIFPAVDEDPFGGGSSSPSVAEIGF